MTREGQRPDPDDELIPPVSTRASDETPPGEDVLVPPFSPGSQGQDAGSPDAFPFDMQWSDEPEEPAEQEPETDPTLAAPADSTVDEDFPFEAFEDDPALPADEESASAEGSDTVDATDEPWSSTPPWSEAASSSAPQPWEPAESQAAGGAMELAERLESLAAKLRAEGADGVEAELASHDRMTSLLAALLAGFLAGRA